MMKMYERKTPNIVEAVQWNDAGPGNLMEVCRLVKENVYQTFSPQGSLLLKVSCGEKVCPKGYFVVKEGDIITVMNPYYFQHVFKETSHELLQM